MSAPRLLAPTTISGGVPTAGAGTLNTIALWTPDGNTLGNSLLTQSGNIVTNASGAIRALGTTQTSPAFTRHDTTTSGIYFPATNEIGFTISNQHAMFISSGRNVGIGTTSPSAQLHISRAGGTSNAEYIRLTNTTVATNSACGITFFQNNAAVPVNRIEGTVSAAGSYDLVSYAWNGSSTAEVMRLQGSTGNVGIGWASPTAKLHVTQGASGSFANLLIGSAGTSTNFYDANEHYWRNGTLATGMYMNASGNVGIGTASPANGLHVVTPAGGTTSGGQITQENTATSSYRWMTAVGGGDNAWVNGRGWFLRDMTAGATRLVCDTSGNVGIGTASPLAKLHTLISGTAVVSAGSDPAPGTLFEGTNTALTTGATSTQQLAIMSNSAVAADAGGGLVLGGKYTGNAYANFAAIKSGKDNATGAEYGGYLAFYTRTNGQAGVGERARIDSAGRILQGVTATPSFTDTVLVNARAGYARSYLYNSTASRGIYQLAGDVSGPYWELGGVTGAIGAETLSSYLVISSNAKNLQFAQSDWGLKLPATPGNADTQTLDCYQENTWTPTLTAFDGTAPTVTTARYTRIGRVVYFEVVLSATGAANFGSTWGNTKVSLPFAPANTIAIPINRNAIGSCGTTSGSDILLTTYAQNAETMRLTGFFSV